MPFLVSSLCRVQHVDATFVDVIHTDARSFFLLEIPGYGMSQACGHIDFYPNNGKEQPVRNGPFQCLHTIKIEDENHDLYAVFRIFV